MRQRLIVAMILLGAFGASAQENPAPVVLDSGSFGDLRARAIGPAVMSGRIAALDVVADDPRIIYVGSAGGGVWKSINAGTTFTPVFDDHVMSIGAVTIDQSKPETVWVGTGEAWTRNSVSVGKGIYKTTDAGKTWTNLGLADTERIAAIAVRPKQSDTVFACAVGRLWSSNDERGVFKTTDGGKTWKKVLFVDAQTGCADIEIDPQEPTVMYAAMWQVRREPYFFTSGGPGSGLYKSTDGGDNWRRVTQGLPEEPLGRIAIAVAPSRAATVYALVESSTTSVYRSDDMGETWRVAGDGRAALTVRARPFYFANLRVDPADHTRLYNPGIFLSVSTNAGRTFQMLTVGGAVHPDTHALWIDPRDPQRLVLGTDGGVYTSHDRGATWSMVGSLPVSQFYHVAFDMRTPYNVYGGLQDNGSWYGPSRVVSGRGIRSGDWTNVGVGDGFHVFPDARDPSIVYSAFQGAQLRRLHQATGEMKDIRPFPAAAEPPYRFNWNAAFTRSAADPSTLLLGGQFVFRSRDRGDSWERISPDLTTNDPRRQRQRESGGVTKDNSGAENHCTIVALAESALEPGVIWAGTDDGNLQVTRDHGRTWSNVVANVPGLPPNTWVSSVEPGRQQRGTAFATFDGHRAGDMKPYLYVTADYGRTWRPLGSGLDGYLHVVRQDPVNQALLFAGSEFGLFVSVDSGARWARLTGNLPAVAIHDIAIHPRDHDLILATHGRGFQIVDDITPLRHLTADVLSRAATILPARASTQSVAAALQEFPGDADFVGGNPPDGAVITYYLKERHIFGRLNLEVLDSSGKLLKTLVAGTRQGVNRVYWNMRLDPPRSAAAPGLGARALAGPMVPEGRYSVRLTKGEEVVTGAIDLIADPAATHAQQDRAQRHALVMRLYAMQGELAYLGDSAAAMRDALRARAKGLTDMTLAAELEQLASSFDALNERLVDRTGGLAQGDPKLREKVIELYGSAMSYGGAPTASQRRYAAALDGELKKAEGEFEALAGTRLAQINERLKNAGAQPVVPAKR